MIYVASQQLERWDEEAKDETTVVPTGYKAFDRHLKRGGFRRGHLTGLLGRSGVGKTALALNFVSRMSRIGAPVLLSSQEMSQPEVTNRLMAATYELPVRLIEEKQREGLLDERWLSRYQEDFSSLVVLDDSEVSFDDLSNACTEFESLVGERPAVVVQDYMTLMSQQGLYGNEAVKVARQARMFKSFAKDEGVAVCTLVQTGRANEGDFTKRNHGHVPLTMEDVMFGGEQAFDVLLGLYRPELDPDLWIRSLDGTENMEALEKRTNWKDKAVLQVVKNRFGMTNLGGSVVYINWESMSFEERDE